MGCVCLLWLDSNNAPKRISALGLKVALKAIRPDAISVQEIALFRRELTVWSGFRHYNILWLLEIIDGGNAGWLAAMDWCFGSLRDLQTNKGKFSLDESSYILKSIVNGLYYAFKKDQVLHLDLKPENILYHLDFSKVEQAEEVKNITEDLKIMRFMVSDWGIASIKQMALNRIAGSAPSSHEAVKTFNNLGTLLYMAPERFQAGYSSSVQSDIFSLGMIFCELLTGRLPFQRNIHPVLSLISGAYLSEIKTALGLISVPKNVKKLILSMVEFNPRNRIGDYQTIMRNLPNAGGSVRRFICKLLGG
jgi:serine/threonine protein kinase